MLLRRKPFCIFWLLPFYFWSCVTRSVDSAPVLLSPTRILVNCSYEPQDSKLKNSYVNCSLENPSDSWEKVVFVRATGEDIANSGVVTESRAKDLAQSRQAQKSINWVGPILVCVLVVGVIAILVSKAKTSYVPLHFGGTSWTSGSSSEFPSDTLADDGSYEPLEGTLHIAPHSTLHKTLVISHGRSRPKSILLWVQEADSVRSFQVFLGVPYATGTSNRSSF